MSETAIPASEASASLDAPARSFLWRKLFSLTGVVPVGTFVLFHLWENAKALQGREAYLKTVHDIDTLPFITVLEVVLILAPLLFHAVLGLKFVLDARYNVGTYGYSRNWMFVLQRVTGVAALGFIGYHLYELRWQKLLGAMDGAGFYDALCRNLSSTFGPVPLIALVYLLGIGAVAFHFANGLWGFLFSWGLTPTRRSQRTAGTVLGVVGLLVFVLGANTTIYFATGSKLFIPSEIGAKKSATPDNCPASVAFPAPAEPASPETEPPSTPKPQPSP